MNTENLYQLNINKNLRKKLLANRNKNARNLRPNITTANFSKLQSVKLANYETLASVFEKEKQVFNSLNKGFTLADLRHLSPYGTTTKDLKNLGRAAYKAGAHIIKSGKDLTTRLRNAESIEILQSIPDLKSVYTTYIEGTSITGLEANHKFDYILQYEIFPQEKFEAGQRKKGIKKSISDFFKPNKNSQSPLSIFGAIKEFIPSDESMKSAINAVSGKVEELKSAFTSPPETEGAPAEAEAAPAEAAPAEAVPAQTYENALDSVKKAYKDTIKAAANNAEFVKKNIINLCLFPGFVKFVTIYYFLENETIEKLLDTNASKFVTNFSKDPNEFNVNATVANLPDEIVGKLVKIKLEQQRKEIRESKNTGNDIKKNLLEKVEKTNVNAIVSIFDSNKGFVLQKLKERYGSRPKITNGNKQISLQAVQTYVKKFDKNNRVLYFINLNDVYLAPDVVDKLKKFNKKVNNGPPTYNTNFFVNIGKVIEFSTKLSNIISKYKKFKGFTLQLRIELGKLLNINFPEGTSGAGDFNYYDSFSAKLDERVLNLLKSEQNFHKLIEFLRNYAKNPSQAINKVSKNALIMSNTTENLAARKNKYTRLVTTLTGGNLSNPEKNALIGVLKKHYESMYTTVSNRSNKINDFDVVYKAVSNYKNAEPVQKMSILELLNIKLQAVAQVSATPNISNGLLELKQKVKSTLNQKLNPNLDLNKRQVTTLVSKALKNPSKWTSELLENINLGFVGNVPTNALKFEGGSSNANKIKFFTALAKLVNIKEVEKLLMFKNIENKQGIYNNYLKFVAKQKTALNLTTTNVNSLSLALKSQKNVSQSTATPNQTENKMTKIQKLYNAYLEANAGNAQAAKKKELITYYFTMKDEGFVQNLKKNPDLFIALANLTKNIGSNERERIKKSGRKETVLTNLKKFSNERTKLLGNIKSSKININGQEKSRFTQNEAMEIVNVLNSHERKMQKYRQPNININAYNIDHTKYNTILKTIRKMINESTTSRAEIKLLLESINIKPGNNAQLTEVTNKTSELRDLKSSLNSRLRTTNSIPMRQTLTLLKSLLARPVIVERMKKSENWNTLKTLPEQNMENIKTYLKLLVPFVNELSDITKIANFENIKALQNAFIKAKLGVNARESLNANANSIRKKPTPAQEGQLTISVINQMKKLYNSKIPSNKTKLMNLYFQKNPNNKNIKNASMAMYTYIAQMLASMTQEEVESKRAQGQAQVQVNESGYKTLREKIRTSNKINGKLKAELASKLYNAFSNHRKQRNANSKIIYNAIRSTINSYVQNPNDSESKNLLLQLNVSKNILNNLKLKEENENLKALMTLKEEAIKGKLNTDPKPNVKSSQALVKLLKSVRSGKWKQNELNRINAVLANTSKIDELIENVNLRIYLSNELGNPNLSFNTGANIKDLAIKLKPIEKINNSKPNTTVTNVISTLKMHKTEYDKSNSAISKMFIISKVLKLYRSLYNSEGTELKAGYNTFISKLKKNKDLYLFLTLTLRNSGVNMTETNPEITYLKQFIQKPNAKNSKLANVMKQINAALLKQNTNTIEKLFQQAKLIGLREHINGGNIKELNPLYKSLTGENLPENPKSSANLYLKLKYNLHNNAAINKYLANTTNKNSNKYQEVDRITKAVRPSAVAES